MKTAIECTNCGGDATDLQFWITVGALVIAFLALLMNFVQFREFLLGSRARANFRLTLSPVGTDPDGVRRTTAGKCATRVALGIKNTGKKAAGETVINVLIPRQLENVRWCGPNGEKLEDKSAVTANTAEKLVGPDGTEHQSMYLVRTLSRVGTKPNHVVFFEFYVEMQKSGEVVVPVRAKVQADEIPDDIEDYRAELPVRVERLPVS